VRRQVCLRTLSLHTRAVALPAARLDRARRPGLAVGLPPPAQGLKDCAGTSVFSAMSRV
jgi:hypothetical protein